MIDGVRKLASGFWLEDDGIARGFAVDGADPSARLVVEILADGLPVALVRAQEVVDVPVAPLVADGCYGFSVRIDDEVLARARRLVARLANSDLLVGSLHLGEVTRRRHGPREAIGAARWAGGLRIMGHLARDPETDRIPSVKALVDGMEVARTSCRSWVQLRHDRVARAFDLHLPDVFADGRVRPVEVRTEAGVELPGSPCLVVAFPDKLADWVDGWVELDSEMVRARFIDGLWPQSLPFEELEGWLARFPVPSATPVTLRRIAAVIVGEPYLDATLASLELQTEVDWSAAALRSTAARIGFDPVELRTFLQEEGADCDLVVVAVSGTVFAPGALALLAEVAIRFPQARAFYSDVLLEASDGRRWPQAFPAFDPELFLETGFCGLVYAIRRDVALASVDGCTSLFDLFPFDETDSALAAPVHLPALLATVPELPAADIQEPLLKATRSRLAAITASASVSRGQAPQSRSVVISRPPASGHVAVVIATRDNGEALDRTLASFDAIQGRLPVRVVVVDNLSTDPATLASLEAGARRGYEILRVPGWFCVPHLLNRAVETLAGIDHLLFIEPGVTAPEPRWLDDMLGRSAASDVGVVGGLVAWPSGVIRDAGCVLGQRPSVTPRFTDRTIDDLGHGYRLDAAHECSAVSATCLLTPRRLFESFHGFDARAFPMHLYAADYCQRVREAGFRVMFDPRIRLRFEAPTSLDGTDSTLGPMLERETQVFRHRWSVAPGSDPFYSPWMTMDGIPYSALAWPPAPFEPRQPAHPIARPLPVGL